MIALAMSGDQQFFIALFTSVLVLAIANAIWTWYENDDDDFGGGE